MSTNLIITIPSLPLRCFQLNPNILRNLGYSQYDSYYNHYCRTDDYCQKSFPCLKNDFFKVVVNKIYKIDPEKFYLSINSVDDHKIKSDELSTNSDPNNEYTLKDLIIVNVLFRVLGGKGGFGKILKTQASKKRQSNNLDSCRNLQGQRIRTVRLSEQMNKWKDKELEKEKVDKNIYKLPKKEEISETIKKDDFIDEKYLETVKKEVTKVKDTVLRGFDKKLSIESQEIKSRNELETKRTIVLDACLDVYDL